VDDIEAEAVKAKTEPEKFLRQSTMATQQRRSPMDLLLPALLQAPLTVAPERAAELQRLIHAHGISIEHDPDSDLEVSPPARIAFGVPYTERLWASACAYDQLLISLFQMSLRLCSYLALQSVLVISSHASWNLSGSHPSRLSISFQSSGVAASRLIPVLIHQQPLGFAFIVRMP
jgi:hypothetical protein